MGRIFKVNPSSFWTSHHKTLANHLGRNYSPPVNPGKPPALIGEPRSCWRSFSHRRQGIPARRIAALTPPPIRQTGPDSGPKRGGPDCQTENARADNPRRPAGQGGGLKNNRGESGRPKKHSGIMGKRFPRLGKSSLN